jgi:hypothetical protein
MVEIQDIKELLKMEQATAGENFLLRREPHLFKAEWPLIHHEI